jgi:hypothetical protein
MWHAWGGEKCPQFWLGGATLKRALGRPRRRWEDNIKMTVNKIGIYGVKWIWLAQDRVLWWAFVHGNVPSGSIKKADVF